MDETRIAPLTGAQALAPIRRDGGGRSGQRFEEQLEQNATEGGRGNPDSPQPETRRSRQAQATAARGDPQSDAHRIDIVV